MQWINENINIILGIVFVLAFIFKGIIIGLIYRIPSISTDELKQKLDKENIKLIDVRSYQEYNQSHIPQAINIPLNELTYDKLDELKAAGDDAIYVICASGNRSLWASLAMKKRGLRPINIKGGMLFYSMD